VDIPLVQLSWEIGNGRRMAIEQTSEGSWKGMLGK